MKPLKVIDTRRKTAGEKIQKNIFNWSPSFISNGNIATGNVSSTGGNWARGGFGLSLCEVHAVDKVTLLQLSVKRF